MSTVEERFVAALEALRAHDSDEAERVERGWLRAISDGERVEIARRAEELAAPRATPRNALVITPGRILDEMNTVRATTEQLDKDIAASMVDANFKAAWSSFKAEFEAFYNSRSGWFDRLWAATYEKTVEFRQRAIDWRDKFVALGGKPTAPDDKLPDREPGEVDRYAHWLLTGGAIYLAIKAVDVFANGRPWNRQAVAERRRLQRGLETAAGERPRARRR